jgi:hypothetical protein
MSSLIALFFILFILIVLVAIIRSSNMYWWDNDEIVETHTTTTTTTTTVDNGAVGGTNNYTGLNVNGFPIVGMITKQWDGAQPYVLDPVDGVKWMLNTTDDLYEDAEGKWWGLQ